MSKTASEWKTYFDENYLSFPDVVKCLSDFAEAERRKPVEAQTEAGETRGVLHAIAEAEQMVYELCRGERRWVMSVPARPDYDPDLVIADGLAKARREILRTRPTPNAGLRELLEEAVYLELSGDGSYDWKLRVHNALWPSRDNPSSYTPAAPVSPGVRVAAIEKVASRLLAYHGTKSMTEEEATEEATDLVANCFTALQLPEPPQPEGGA